MKANAQAACPVCKHDAGNYAFPVQEYAIFKCANCGLEFTHPAPTEEQLKNFYSSYHDIRARTDVVNLNISKNLDVLRKFGLNSESDILDFGTGSGNFVTIAGENCYGIELHDAGVSRVYTSLDRLPVTKFDYITLWGVLEHLIDPLSIIKTLSGFLKDDGRIVITTVDAEGVIPYYYKPVEHLTYWTKKSFDMLFESCGLRLIHSEPYTMLQAKEVYLDRLLSRTPDVYKDAFSKTLPGLPDYVEIPTNEILVIAQKLV